VNLFLEKGGVILMLKELIMKTKRVIKTPSQLGFTIIETIIALAIAGLIMIIVFIAIPQAQVHIRDNQRKAYARTVYEAMLEFIKNNGRLPSCDNAVGSPQLCPADENTGVGAGAKHFLAKYMPAGKDPSLGEDYVDPTNLNTPDGGTWHSGNTYFHFSSSVVDHSALGDPAPPDDFRLGHIVIGTGHWCSYSLPETDLSAAQQWYPIHSSGLSGADIQLDKFFIVIGVERGLYYCLDNYAG
jgi:prepilin-type N-terminal cleavage/methylation domain-containing protein